MSEPHRIDIIAVTPEMVEAGASMARIWFEDPNDPWEEAELEDACAAIFRAMIDEHKE